MNKNYSNYKVTAILILGNILEYYDFLLFAHLGYIITPVFFPNYSSTHTHILSLALFGLSFIIRPIGGVIFGKIADVKGRKKALINSVKCSVIPAIGIGLLPDYQTIGVISCYIFILLRLAQGFALGGEYPVAGIYLMEMRKTNQGLFSSLFVGSGTVGSLLALGFAAICITEGMPSWTWRVAFIIGGLGGFLSYFMRKNLQDAEPSKITKVVKPSDTLLESMKTKRILVFALSMLASTTMWIPTTYSNFYVTKILNQPSNIGLYTSFIGLFLYIFILPITGIIYDKINSRKYLLFSIGMVTPLSFASVYFLSENYIVLAQLGLMVSASIIGAPIHKFMYDLFPAEIRGRNIGFIFVSGLSFGGILPSISGYIVSKTQFYLAPACLISIVAIIVFFCFYKLYNPKLLFK